MKPRFIAPLLKIAGKLFIGIVLIPSAALAATAPALPSYAVDAKQASVSGLSSGAFMAAQFHVVYSSTLIGAGIIAGGPYYCALSNPSQMPAITALTTCMSPLDGKGPDAVALVAQAKVNVQQGLIDDLSNLQKSRVYLFSGTADTTVRTIVVDQAAEFYKLAGIAADHIEYSSNIAAGHAIITANSNDTACSATAPPFVNDCHFIQSQKILEQIYGKLNPPVTTLSGSIISFNQKEFIHKIFSGMSDEAYAYVPKSCEAQTCKVHVAFHGCEQGSEKIGNLFYTKTGYNELADSNHIIVLYPQVRASNGFFSPFNPKGCWDFWGYSDLNPFHLTYFTNKGNQMTAIKEMLDRMAQPRHQ